MNDNQSQLAQPTNLADYEPRKLPAPTTTIHGTCLFVDLRLRVDYELQVTGHLPVLISQIYSLVQPSNGWNSNNEKWLTPTLISASFDVLNNHLTLYLGATEAINDLPMDLHLFKSMLSAGGWLMSERPLDPSE